MSSSTNPIYKHELIFSILDKCPTQGLEHRWSAEKCIQLILLKIKKKMFELAL